MKRTIPVLLVMVILFSGCSYLGWTKQSPIQEYASAKLEFMYLLEQYIKYYKEADPEVRQAWSEKIDPTLYAAKAALDVWGISVMADKSDAGEKAEAYANLRDKLFELILPIIQGGD